MAKSVRPRTLAAAFGAYFLIMALVSWNFASGLSAPWYRADLTRWVYTTYMLVAAIFLMGLGGLAVSIRRSFSRRIRELERRYSPRQEETFTDTVPPPLPETVAVRDNVDRDIDELLESLSEVEATAAKEAEALETQAVGTVPEPISPGASPPDMAASDQRDHLMKRQKALGRFVAGPGLVAAMILGVSGMMLPGSDGFAQYYFQLNTALILGIGYTWIGVGAYIAATITALVSPKGDDRKK